jgi:hypothetical protein
MAIGALIVVLLLIFPLDVLRLRIQRELDSSASSEALACASEAELSPVSVVNVEHDDSETFYWEQSATLWELKNRAEVFRGSDGVSLRATRAYRRGRLELPLPRDFFVQFETGTVYLSDSRVLFKNGRYDIEIQFDSIRSIDPYMDGVRVATVDTRSTAIETGDGRIAVVLWRLVNKQVGASTDR